MSASSESVGRGATRRMKRRVAPPRPSPCGRACAARTAAAPTVRAPDKGYTISIALATSRAGGPLSHGSRSLARRDSGVGTSQEQARMRQCTSTRGGVCSRRTIGYCGSRGAHLKLPRDACIPESSNACDAQPAAMSTHRSLRKARGAASARPPQFDTPSEHK